ncbi:MAG: amidohydrolase family protein [Pseudomonadales bacterium]|nr:amidohydrolase family protein [Pseudomonadales bacterium]
MDPDWLPFDPEPSKPVFQLPVGAVDTHCHVFGPAHEFPFAAERKYTPCDAGSDQLWELRDHLGFTRNVVVQATCHGSDNRAMVNALESSKGKARGVATVRADVADEELQQLNHAGVRGVRFNFVKRLADKLPTDDLLSIAERIAPLGWHIVIYSEAEELDEIWDLITALPTKVVVDHMGRPDVGQPAEGQKFAQFIELMEMFPNFLSKVTCPERLSKNGPPNYDDFVPFARLLVERFPDRVLWGTDWPHPNMKSHMPDDGHLVNIIPRIAPTQALQQALLIDNPMGLYWPEEG